MMAEKTIGDAVDQYPDGIGDANYIGYGIGGWLLAYHTPDIPITYQIFTRAMYLNEVIRQHKAKLEDALKYFAESAQAERDGWSEWVEATSEKLFSWNGEGLPPAGCECEYKRKNVNFKTKFVRAKPIFFSDQIVVLEHWASGNHFSERIEDCVFRPLKTEAEREIDSTVADMEREIEAEGLVAVSTQLYILARAGYRKQEKTNEE